MSSNEQIKFRTEVYFIPSLGIIKSPDSTQKLNHSEQNILTFLVNNHHRPVSKDELLNVGWPDRNVTEASLFQAIRALRVKLQESSKGDVIETLPRVGYQITRFERLESPLNPTAPTGVRPRSVKIWGFFAVVFSLLMFALGTYFWLNHYKHPEPVNYLTNKETWDSNSLTLIATNQQDLDDLGQKLDVVYQQHMRQVHPAKIVNMKIFAYKGDGLYSIAWCRVDKDEVCIPKTDFSYTVEGKDWQNFTRFLISDVKTSREDPVIQTDLAREPTSQVFMNYLDDSGVQSKIVQHYISRDTSGDLNYSYMSFITERTTDYHHALSIRAATLSIIENHSPFLATAELKPEMFHWAYQPNDIIPENKSTALVTEQRMRDDYKIKRIAYSYLLYQQPFLDLVFYPGVGIYWVNNSIKNTKLFNFKRYTPPTNQD